mgnify:CR=1 FL=1
MTQSAIFTANAMRDTACHTAERYDTLRSKIADILRDPNMPEDQTALLTALDEHAAKAPHILGKLIDSEDLNELDTYDIGFANIYISEIDTFEDNLPKAVEAK